MNLPRLHDYFGAWAIESGVASGLLEHGRGILANLPAHMAAHSAQVAAANASAKMELIPCEDDEGQPGGGAVAVIRLEGTLMKAAGSASESSSTVRVRQAVKAAAADPAVRAIILHIDSPGGTVSGTADLAAEVAAADKIKPVHAYVEDQCCSAAYWIASQCRSITANCGTAMIGSIGAMMVLVDASAAAEKSGVRPVLIATGQLKGAGTYGLAIDEGQRDYFLNLVTSAQAYFAAAVQDGRRFSDDEMAALSSGRVWRGEEALALRLIDAIAPFDQLLAQVSAAASPSLPDATNNPKEPKKMNIFAKMFGVKDDAEAKAKLEAIEAEHKAIADQLSTAQAKVAALKSAADGHAEALAALAQEHQARAEAIISGICQRKLTEAEALAALNTPAAELAKSLETKAQSVPAPVAGIAKSDKADILAQFGAIADVKERQAFYAKNASALEAALASAK